MKRNKKIGITISIIILAIIVLLGGAFFYKEYKINKIMTVAKEDIKNKEYDKALNEVNELLEKKPNNEEGIKLKSRLTIFLESKDLYNKNKLDEAKSKIDEIKDFEDGETTFKEEIDKLKEDINKEIKEKEEKAAKELAEKKKIEEEKRLAKEREELEKKKALENKIAEEKREKEKLVAENNSSKVNDRTNRNNNTQESLHKESNVENKEVARANTESDSKNSRNRIEDYKVLTEKEASQLIRKKLGNRDYKYEGISASDLEGIFCLYRYGKTLYCVNLNNGEITDGYNGNVYSKPIR